MSSQLRRLRLKQPTSRKRSVLLIEQYEYLTRQIAQAIDRTGMYMPQQTLVRRSNSLFTAPGIGKLTAIEELLVELQDITRFKSAEEIASYIGLTPAEYSTGERTRQGRRPGAGAKRVRTYLVESTWVLITKNPVPSAKYLKLKSLRGGKRAVITIARKFLVRARPDTPGQRALSDGSLTQNMTITLSGYGLTVDLHLVTNKDYVL